MMNNQIMSFNEFVGTSFWSDCLREDALTYIEFHGDSVSRTGFIYDGSDMFVIEELEDGRFYLNIENEQFFSSNLHELEKIIYGFYKMMNEF